MKYTKSPAHAQKQCSTPNVLHKKPSKYVSIVFIKLDSELSHCFQLGHLHVDSNDLKQIFEVTKLVI